MAERLRYSPLLIKGAGMDFRAQRMRLPSVVEALNDLARWGYNAVMVEYFDKFPFSRRLREAVAPDAFSRTEVREIARVARDLGLQIIPHVQCLGHMEWALRRPRFRRLGEEEGPLKMTLCPSDPGSQKLFREVTSQILEMHPDGRYFHMGGDEAALNPDCPRCRARRKSVGVSRLLVDYYIDCAKWLRSQGPDPIMWCDMPLRHPEALDLLCGHVIIMDWDYWSTAEANRALPNVWGVPKEDVFRPETWPAAHREIVKPYIFFKDGKTLKPFPYTRMLRDRGFQVIVAPAVRSMGDSFCTPKALAVDNCTGGTKTAAEAHVLGVMVTSWALRRAPWPLTEYALIAAAMTIDDPQVSRKEIDSRFAKEHFGIADPKLARIPTLMGHNCAGHLVEALDYPDTKTAHYFALDYGFRVPRATQNAAESRRSFARLRSDLKKAAALLRRARPSTPRQRKRVTLWWWANEVLSHFADFGPQVLKKPGTHDPGVLREYQKSADALCKKTDRLLRPMLTDYTMISEEQIRFGIHRDYIKEMISAAERARSGARRSAKR